MAKSFQAAIFFFVFNLASSVARYHGQLSLYTILEKTNDPILAKFRTDAQRDENDFIESCLTNAERPKIKKNMWFKYDKNLKPYSNLCKKQKRMCFETLLNPIGKI